MKTITVKVNNEKNTQILTEMLKSLSYVKSIEVYEDEPKLTSEEIAMVEERWAAYKKNPKSTSSWATVKKRIRKKHGI